MASSEEIILELDLGNTRIKWRLWLNTTTSVAGFCHYQDCHHQDSLSEKIYSVIDAPVAIERIRLASVVEPERLQLVLEQCVGLSANAPQQAVVRASCGGLRPAYANLQNLGVDRWLAMLAAHHRYQGDCVVVGCGTAVTVDLVSANGNHLGGYIVPGLELMRDALFRRTGSVRLAELPVPDTLTPGDDTVPAVANGLLLMLRGLIETARQQLFNASGADRGDESQISEVVVVMTGGDAGTIMPFVKGSPVYNEHLVLDGLAIALP